jgi:hypothetical protein
MAVTQSMIMNLWLICGNRENVYESYVDELYVWVVGVYMELGRLLIYRRPSYQLRANYWSIGQSVNQQESFRIIRLIYSYC